MSTMDQGATPSELSFLRTVGSMWSRPEYLLPLVAAERQYRDHFYRLNAGALLEDLFYNAFTNFVNQHNASHVLVRAPKGKQGWDYQFDGNRISHKVYKGGPIAAIWDPTLLDQVWTFSHAVHVVIGSHLSKHVDARDDSGGTYKLKGASAFKKRMKPASYLLVVEQDHGSDLSVMRVWRVPAGSDRLWHHVPFSEVWRTAAESVENGAKWNQIELFECEGHSIPDDIQVLRVKPGFLRPGSYLLPQAWLKDVAVERNNRALLIPKHTASSLLLRAQRESLSAPITTWYQHFAEDRPPDLYSTQRLEFDALFGVNGFRR
ncbi:MAG: hypothetical protein ACKOCB_10635 [Planctomycetia bacterium]